MNGIIRHARKDFSLQAMIFCFLFISCSAGFAQVGLRDYLPLVERQDFDSSRIKFSSPVLPLRNWHIMTDQYFQVENEANGLNIYNYISPNYIPRNPFELDLRYTSNYVPREVADELNLMMNRPRDSAFLPILPVAFLALQLASQYILISKKTEITAENIRSSEPALPVLKALWRENPQTLTQLYQDQNLSASLTMGELQNLVQLLIDNKLVKTREIENAETKYFHAMDQQQYNDILNRENAKSIFLPNVDIP